MSKQTVRNQMLKTFCIICCALLLNACMSGGPATKYYALFSDKNVQPLPEGITNIASIGVGPIVLPDFLENPSIVSVSSSQRVVVSGYHVWAGDLKDGISRVLSDNLGAYYESSNVWAFPWDVRTRPQYQVRVEFLDLSGERGKSVQLKAKWSLIDSKADSLVALGQVSFSEKTSDESYDEYVGAVNRNLHQLSLALAEKVQGALVQANGSGTLSF